MAESVTDSEAKPPPKRRRILDPSAIVPVPVYSNKLVQLVVPLSKVDFHLQVSSSLQLKPTAAMFTDEEDDAEDQSLWSRFSSRGTTAAFVSLSDSEEEEEEEEEPLEKRTEPESVRSPSPPPERPVQKQSRRVKQKICEIDRKLRAVNSLLTPEPQTSRSRLRRGLRSPDEEDEDVVVLTAPSSGLQDEDVVVLTAPSSGLQDEDVVVLTAPSSGLQDEDVVVLSTPSSGLQDSAYSSSVREIPLKVRCRTDVHKIPVLSSTPLSDVVTQMSVILNVPPPRLLLLQEEEELPPASTVSELGLGIADIIECVVMAAEEHSDISSSIITVRLQGNDRDSAQEFSLHRDAPLGSIFSQYLSKMAAGACSHVRFHFDGCKVSAVQTPAQLDMEDGDIVEVWV